MIQINILILPCTGCNSSKKFSAHFLGNLKMLPLLTEIMPHLGHLEGSKSPEINNNFAKDLPDAEV